MSDANSAITSYLCPALLHHDDTFALASEQWTPNQGTGASTAAIFDAAGNILTFPHELSGYEGLTRAYNDANEWIGCLDGEGHATGGGNFAYDVMGNPTTWKGNTRTFDRNAIVRSFPRSPPHSPAPSSLR